LGNEKNKIVDLLIIMERNRVTEKKKHVASKVEKLRGSQPSVSGWNEKPSRSMNKSSYDMTMQDA
jgi:hypothetical protein